MIQKRTPPIVRRGMVQLTQFFFGYFVKEVSKRSHIVSPLFACFTAIGAETSLVNRFTAPKTFFSHISSTPFFIKVLFRPRIQSKPLCILSHAPNLTYSGASNLLKSVKISAWEVKSKVVKSVSCVEIYIKPYQYQEKIRLNIIIGHSSNMGVSKVESINQT